MNQMINRVLKIIKIHITTVIVAFNHNHNNNNKIKSNLILITWNKVSNNSGKLYTIFINKCVFKHITLYKYLSYIDFKQIKISYLRC
jgi:hypothetical protein